MGWIQKLFGKSSDVAPVVVLETGESRADQAVCVKLDGAHIVDLRPLPAEADRVLRAIAQVTPKLAQSPQAIQVWVVSNRVLEAFRRSTDTVAKLTDALFAATRGANPMMIVEEDAPAGMVYILRSLGFEVYLPGMCLTAVDARGRTSEIDVLAELDRIRRAPRLRV